MCLCGPVYDKQCDSTSSLAFSVYTSTHIHTSNYVRTLCVTISFI